MGAFFGEDDHGIHARQRGEDGCPLLLRDERSPGAFEFAHGMIPIKANDEQIAELAGALEVAHMAEVEQVETTVGGDDALAAPARVSGPSRRLSQR